MNNYNLLPFRCLNLTSVLAVVPCTFWRLNLRIPLHSDDAMSWCARAAERAAARPALGFAGTLRGFEGSRRSRLRAVPIMRVLCLRSVAWDGEHHRCFALSRGNFGDRVIHLVEPVHFIRFSDLHGFGWGFGFAALLALLRIEYQSSSFLTVQVDP